MVPSAQLHLFTYQGKETLVSLAQDTRLLGYRYEDYSGGSYRFKDDPVEKNYDWTALGIRVLGGLVIVGTVVVGAGVFTAGIAGINTSMVMGAAAVYESMAVGATAVNDMVQGQVSGMSEYVRVAFNGSIIGAMTGATACIPVKGLGIMGKYAAEFCIGAGESAFEQKLWEGKINFKEAAGHGILSVILTGVIDNLPGQGRKVIEGGSVPDFYVGLNGKALPSQYKDWIGINIQKELLEQAENPQLQNAIKQLYRGNSFIGDGGTADIIRFEQQTGLRLGKNGGSHVQKGIDMAKYIENKILTQDLSPSDRVLATQLLEDLYNALGR